MLADVDKALAPHIVDDPTRSLLYKPFAEFPDAIQRRPTASAWRPTAKAAIAEQRRARLSQAAGVHDARVSAGLPRAGRRVGAAATAASSIAIACGTSPRSTSTRKQVHDTGLAEVQRIKAEMEAVIKRVGFKGDFPAFVEFLRTDPQFYVDTPEQLLKEVSLVLKRMDGELPKLFKTLPRTPYGIREIPDFIAPRTTTAYYMPPAGDGSRAGFYYVNTYNLKSRPLFEIEALSLHEAVPGHHIADRPAAGAAGTAAVSPLRRTPRRSSRAGACTPSGWAWKSASTRIPTATSAG